MIIDKEWLFDYFSEEDAYYLSSSLLFNEIIIRFIGNLPRHVRGLITLDREGRYNVYINNRLSQEATRDAIHHELDHILKNDLYSEHPVEELENYLSGV